MQTQSRLCLCCVLFIHVNVLNFTFFFIESNVFCDPTIFYHAMGVKKNFLAHKKHWNATVCAFFMTNGTREREREKKKSPIRHKLTTRKNFDLTESKKLTEWSKENKRFNVCSFVVDPEFLIVVWRADQKKGTSFLQRLIQWRMIYLKIISNRLSWF